MNKQKEFNHILNALNQFLDTHETKDKIDLLESVKVFIDTELKTLKQGLKY